VKATDDYDAKIDIWARNPCVVHLPEATGLPRFGVKRFSSYEELNEWKRSLLLQLAERGGVRWTK